MPTNRTEKRIKKLIRQSLKGNRNSQRQLYQAFYAYGMTICIRYAQNREEAEEVLNDAFFKAFQNLHKYDFERPFKGWFQRIVVNTAIDRLRRNKKNLMTDELEYAREASNDAEGLSNMSAEEILELIQQLAPSYRAVFNLYVIEGYSHREIAEKLSISEGTSKSNLAMARKRLKAMYLKLDQTSATSPK